MLFKKKDSTCRNSEKQQIAGCGGARLYFQDCGRLKQECKFSKTQNKINNNNNNNNIKKGVVDAAQFKGPGFNPKYIPPKNLN